MTQTEGTDCLFRHFHYADRNLIENHAMNQGHEIEY